MGSDPLVVVDDADDPFAVLDDQPEVTGSPEGATGGGWVGYLGYGLGRLVERLPPPPRRPVPVPASMLAFYDHLLRRDEVGNVVVRSPLVRRAVRAAGVAPCRMATPQPRAGSGSGRVRLRSVSPEPGGRSAPRGRGARHRAHPLRRRLPGQRLHPPRGGILRGPARAVLRRRRSSRAALRRLPRSPVVGGGELLARALPPAPRPPRPQLADQGHGEARAGLAAPARAAARFGEGPGGERDDRRPHAQRSRPRVPLRQRRACPSCAEPRSTRASGTWSRT